MSLENLSSVFNDISKNIKDDRVKDARSGDKPPANTSLEKQVNDTNFNILDKIDRIDIRGDSPVGNLALDAGNFTNLPFFKGNIEFKNKSQQLIGGTSFIDEEISHNFGFTTFDDIIKIEPIQRRQKDSPQTQIQIGEFTGYGEKNDEKVNNRKDDLFQNIGQDNRLGQGAFTFGSLYNLNHRAVGLGDRVAIPTGQTYMLNGEQKQVEINTLRSGMGDLSLLQPGSKPSAKVGFRGFSRGKEPYLMQDIGSDRYATLTNRDTLPLNRALDDVSRLAEFYKSDAGLAYIAKENVTNIVIGDSIQPFRTDKILLPPVPNPVQGNTGFLNITNQFRELGQELASLRKPTTIEYSRRKDFGGALPFKNLGDKLDDKPITQALGLTRFKDLSGFTALGTKTNVVDNISDADSVVAPFESDELTDSTFGAGGDAPLENAKGLLSDTQIKIGDFYVRIKDLRDNKFIYFRGYVTGITENANPSFTPVNYIGRSEPVYLYERGERDLSFNLRVYPANDKQFEKMYERIERLTSLIYPKYLPDEDEASLTRMKAPFTELYMAHIGSPAKGQFGFIKSLSYTVNENGDWDFARSLPRLFDIAIGYQILSKKPPQLGGDKLYRIKESKGLFSL